MTHAPHITPADLEELEHDRTSGAWRSVARLSGSSTYVTEAQLLTLFTHYQPARVLLAARLDDANGAVLTAVVSLSDGSAYLADHSLLNFARGPRIAELRAVFAALVRARVPDVRYATVHAPETSDLRPTAAVHILEGLRWATLAGQTGVNAFGQLLGARDITIAELGTSDTGALAFA